MTFYANDVHPVPPDHCADSCDDQLPLITRVGRGLKGDASRVDVTNGRIDTHLTGGWIDGADGTFHTEWVSDNINGGELSYQYNLNPYTVPRTFTITFIYRRGHEGDENHVDWSWTTPAIPYIWRVQDEDGGSHEDPDHIVGSGVATLFIKTMHDANWNERLHYPIDPLTGEPYDRDYFNAPEAEQPWSATIRFGKGGDIEVPDFDDLAKIIGVTKQDLFDILEGDSVTINGIDARNLIDYIDKCDKRDKDDVLNHLHKDLGYNQGNAHDSNTFGVSPITNGTYGSVKSYIDEADKALKKKGDDLAGGLAATDQRFANLLASLGDLIYGVTFNPDGTIKTRPANMHVPVGNINLFSNATEGSDNSAVIRTHSSHADNDIRIK